MKKLISATIVSVLTCSAWAQETEKPNLGQIEVSVTEKYKAQVMAASRISETADYSDSTVQKLAVNYAINSQPITVHFQPNELKPARIAKVKVPDLYKGMVRLGYGLYNTPLADVYYNNGRSSKLSYGFKGSHFSTQTGVKDILYENNSLSQNELGAYINSFKDDFTLYASADANWDKFSYYGQPKQTAEDTALGEAPFVWYRTYSFKGGIRQAKVKDLGWLNNAEVGYTNFSDNYGSVENDMVANTSWQVPADEYNLNFDIGLAYFNTAYDSLYSGADSTNLYDQSTFQFQMRPQMTSEFNDILIDFGFNIFSLTQTDSRLSETENKLYFFPEVKLRYEFVPNVLNAFGGIEGNLKRNTYRELVNANPYMVRGQTHTPTSTLDLYAGLFGKLTNKTGFTIRGGFRQDKNAALFYRDVNYASDSVENGLNVVYDRVNSFYIRGAISTNFNDNFMLNAFAEYRSLETKDEFAAWYIPNFRANLSLDYTLKEKISFSLISDFVEARDAVNTTIIPNSEQLPAYLNVDLNIEYTYNTKLFAFVQLSNLFNSQYDIYLGYRTQSIGAIMGFGYRF